MEAEQNIFFSDGSDTNKPNPSLKLRENPQVDQHLSFEKCPDCLGEETKRAFSHFHISKVTELEKLIGRMRKHFEDEEDTSLLFLVLKKLTVDKSESKASGGNCGTSTDKHCETTSSADLDIKEEDEEQQWDSFNDDTNYFESDLKEDGDDSQSDEDYNPLQDNMETQGSRQISSQTKNEEDKKEERRRKKAARDRAREKGKVWLCEECGKEFSCRSTKWRHVAKVHRQDPEGAYGHGAQSKPLDLECPICGLSMHVNKYRFTLHKQVCEAEKTGVNPFVCAICGKSFAASVQLSNHKTSCSGKRKEIYQKAKQSNVCTYPGCDFKSEKKKDLEKHTNRVHLDLPSKKNFVCPTCGNSYVSLGVLKIHVKTVHEGEKPWECSLCGKRFGQKISWSKHVKTHTGEAAWTCPLCKKLMKNDASRYNHSKFCTGLVAAGASSPAPLTT